MSHRIWPVVLLAVGCGSPPSAERPTRSPTRDYPADPPQTSDGQVVGADGKAPADTLEQGPTQERPAPGWSTDHGEPSYDPTDRVGGATDRDEKADSEEEAEHENE
jgi:hypothetical protein